MQKTLQKKFVITAMAAISVLLLILLGAINGLNFWQTDRQTDRLLETLTRQAAAAPRSEPGMLPFPDMSGKREPGDFSARQLRKTTPCQPGIFVCGLTGKGALPEPISDGFRLYPERKQRSTQRRSMSREKNPAD